MKYHQIFFSFILWCTTECNRLLENVFSKNGFGFMHQLFELWELEEDELAEGVYAG